MEVNLKARVAVCVVLGFCAAATSGIRLAAETATVAQDGSGQFQTVQAAIDAAPQTTSPSARWTIHVPAGTYRERLYVQREKRFIRITGDGEDRTTIAFDLFASMAGPDGKPIGTFQTPTVWIDADDLAMDNLTIANTAGNKGQALALRVDGDRVSFRNCRFTGWQDTILLNRGRQYFDSCYISGAVDFIFGGATAYFNSCDILCEGNGYITAASTPASQPFGLVFSGCRIDGKTPTVQTYLGRPWRPYAAVAFIGTTMSRVVRPEGWNNWKKPEREKTVRYSEFMSSGAGSSTTDRVSWARTSAVAPTEDYTVARVLAGSDHWDPSQELAPEAARPSPSPSPSAQPGQSEAKNADDRK